MNVARHLPIALAVVLALCPRAHADSFTVTGGNITLTTPLGSASFTLTGDGFSLGGHVEQGIGGCTPCSSLDTVTLRGPLSDITFGGAPGSFNGVDYASIWFNGTMHVNSESFLGSQLLTSTTVMVPFTFSADLLSGYPSARDAFEGTNRIFQGNFSGNGTVTAQFTQDPPRPGQAPIFDLNSAVFQFGASSTSPTPEPATLLLFGMGAAATAAMRRRTRTRYGSERP